MMLRVKSLQKNYSSYWSSIHIHQCSFMECPLSPAGSKATEVSNMFAFNLDYKSIIEGRLCQQHTVQDCMQCCTVPLPIKYLINPQKMQQERKSRHTILYVLLYGTFIYRISNQPKGRKKNSQKGNPVIQRPQKIYTCTQILISIASRNDHGWLRQSIHLGVNLLVPRLIPCAQELSMFYYSPLDTTIRGTAIHYKQICLIRRY